MPLHKFKLIRYSAKCLEKAWDFTITKFHFKLVDVGFYAITEAVVPGIIMSEYISKHCDLCCFHGLVYIHN